MTDGKSVVLMSQERIVRTLRRIAFQIFEQCKGSADILLLGIDRRGYFLAKQLGDLLESTVNDEVPVQRLRINEDGEKLSDLDVEDKYVILVDDVIFTGKTIYTALQRLYPFGTPRKLMLAVLVDRGHRAYPIEAQFTGLISPTKLDEHVQVEFAGDQVRSVKLITEKKQLQPE